MSQSNVIASIRLMVCTFTLCLTVAGAINPIAAEKSSIILQSTTSTQNSGLLDYVLPQFTKLTGINVRVVAVGTGQALKNAEKGDGDVLLVHAKTAEEAFIKNGFGVKRYDVMFNDFIIVGPANDPAKITGIKDIRTVLNLIAKSQSPFASRGDDSGTHKKELKLWEMAKLNPKTAKRSWYRETGSGMGATLNIAAGMNAYTMTDRGTWIAFKNKRNLKILVEGNGVLFNQYGIMLVNPERHKHTKAKAGQAFIDWLISPSGQNAIKSYKIKGQQLFFPNARP